MFQESNGVSSVGHDDKVKGRCLPDISDLLKLQDSEDEFEIDPEIKEQIDRYSLLFKLCILYFCSYI